ncbi:MAG: helix-turn-helix domain-containing protein [Planctomycetales bacterium]|nr:helix-turn-helix domain-containing protein [Planctomycetales bacterium]
MTDLSPKAVAEAIGVSESSLKRWCDQGLIAMIKTPGGHRRLSRAAVVDFLRESQRKVIKPELLGLPADIGSSIPSYPEATEALTEAFRTGNEVTARRIVLDLHLAGHSLSVLCDEVVVPAFVAIGHQWECGSVEVYQERLACEICEDILHRLESLLVAPTESAPLALGATPECDPYTLPTKFVECVLRQHGWDAHSLGSRIPFTSLTQAAKTRQPRLMWISTSHIEDEPKFVAEFRQFYNVVKEITAVVVGGRGFHESLRRQLEYAAYCDNLQHLEAFAASLFSP